MSAQIDYEALFHAQYFTPGGLHKTAVDEDTGERQRNWGAPGGVILWGGPGGGKTTQLERLAERVDGACFILDSTMGEGGLGATPVPDLAKKVLRFLPADFFSVFDDKPGVFAVDDMTTFAPALQPYLLGMLLNKRIGSHYLGPKVRMFGAANEPMDAPGGWDLAPAVANRCCHIDFPDASIEDWCHGLSTMFEFKGTVIDAEKEEARVLKAWPGAFAKAAGYMSGFSSKRREMHRFNPHGSGVVTKAFYTPRTKVFATIALASGYVHKLNEATSDTYVAGYVGEAFATEFGTWRRAQDLPDAAKFLDVLTKMRNGEQLDDEDAKSVFEHNSARIDRTAALLHSCCSLIEPESCVRRKDRVRSLWTFMDSIAKTALDSVADIVIQRLYKSSLVAGYPEAKAVLKKMRPMLDATEHAGAM